MPKLQKGKIVFKLPPTLSISFRQIIAIIIILGTASLGAVLYKSHGVRGANYGWAQTTWSGGASTTATGKHSTDQSGWTKYQSKSALLSTSTEDQLTLKATSTFWTDTTSNNFASGTLSGTYNSNGTVYLKKPNGVSCSNVNECKDNYCNNVCGHCGGWLYNSSCLYIGGENQSCDTICSARGGSAGAYNDDSNCTALKHYGACGSGCVPLSGNTAPMYMTSNGYCYYNTGTWSSSGLNSGHYRLCACNS